MLNISLRDQNWAHVNTDITSMFGNDLPQYMRWDRQNMNNDIMLFTDQCLKEVDNYNNKYKIAMMGEPRVIIGQEYYDWITQNAHKFSYVLTYYDELLKKIPNARFYTSSGSFLWKKDWQLWPKTKNLAMIASHKNYAPGHKFRFEVVNAIGAKCGDFYGHGFGKSFENHIDVMKDYRFHIAILNSSEPCYWTDILQDCLLTGTVPIFWLKGEDWLKRFFNPEGYILFETIDQLDSILDEVNANGLEIYNSKIEAIKDNLERAKEPAILEDYLYLNFFKPLLENGKL